MPSINVSLKDGASADQLDAAKKQVTDQGGKIVNEFKLIKGFTAEFPADKVHTLQSNEHLNVEADGQVKTHTALRPVSTQPHVLAQRPTVRNEAYTAVDPSSTTQPVISTLSPQIDATPSLTPTVYDPVAPDAQQCPGYTASNIQNTSSGFTADLTLAGSHCQAYGNDIDDLTLEVQYQTKDRLNVKIYPKNIAPENSTQYILPSSLVLQPVWDGETTAEGSDLSLTWTNDPSFQFKITRSSSGEELFSTYGHVIVFEDQFLELVTNMVADYNVYGLAENIHDWRLGNNFTQTFWATDSGNTVDGNVYGTFPWYQETRYNSAGNTTSHGVYARNALGQEWLLRENNITYRTLGGSFDLYFLSGQDADGSSSALTTIRQFTNDCVGAPAMQQYWQAELQPSSVEHETTDPDIVSGYRDANIPLESMWNDIDIYELYRDFTNDANTFPIAGIQAFIASLHADGQHYVPIVDSNIYVPNPDNASDAYAPFERGAALGTYIRDPTTGDFFIGDNWPGFSVWADWLVQSSRDWWTSELMMWYNDTSFDGIWIDLSEPSSFCVGSCGNGRTDENPVHPPFLLPNDPYQANYNYPEGFNVSNATEAASVTSASASQASYLASHTLLPVPVTTTQGRTNPTPGVKNLDFPPYVLNAVQAGHSLLKGTVAPNGDTVMRALAWEFPNDPSLAGTFSQFMLGPSLLVTPVLIPNVDTVNGTFPGIGEGTNWYDWYTLQPVVAQAHENVTLSAPLEHINVHVRGGAILPLQAPAYTTAETRANPYSLVVALDQSGQASGSLYLDDGESLVQNATKLVQFSYTDNCLSTTINGTYHAAPPLANVTIAGATSLPKSLSLTIAGQPCEVSDVVLDYSAGVLYVRGIEQFTPSGAWEGEMKMEFSY
ncbi:hypothetical protein B0A55_00179 [Friedmanniomyces simplex]|uniref:alpha-glucosidase n=1 Tax=Friedmanniomyces simplex TaxID=329884 RepID=A0A4U0Y855_9PEZI|nr:hypothetical protein B0A55_00179 [Friedmanniomyces simplex]